MLSLLNNGTARGTLFNFTNRTDTTEVLLATAARLPPRTVSLVGQMQAVGRVTAPRLSATLPLVTPRNYVQQQNQMLLLWLTDTTSRGCIAYSGSVFTVERR